MPNNPQDIIREAAESLLDLSHLPHVIGDERSKVLHAKALRLYTLQSGVWLDRETAEIAHDALRYWEQKTELYEDERLEQAAATIRRQLEGAV